MRDKEQFNEWVSKNSEENPITKVECDYSGVRVDFSDGSWALIDFDYDDLGGIYASFDNSDLSALRDAEMRRKKLQLQRGKEARAVAKRFMVAKLEGLGLNPIEVAEALKG